MIRFWFLTWRIEHDEDRVLALDESVEIAFSKMIQMLSSVQTAPLLFGTWWCRWFSETWVLGIIEERHEIRML